MHRLRRAGRQDYAVALSPDGRQLATAGAHGTLAEWAHYIQGARYRSICP